MSGSRLTDDQFKPQGRSGTIPEANTTAYEVVTLPAEARELITRLVDEYCSTVLESVAQASTPAHGLLLAGDHLFELNKLPQETREMLESACKDHSIAFDARYTEIYTDLVKRHIVDYASQFIADENDTVRMTAMRVYAKSGLEDSRIAEVAFTTLLSRLIPEPPDMLAGLALHTLSKQNLSNYPRDKVDVIATFVGDSYSIQARVMACAALGKVGPLARDYAPAMTDVLGEVLRQKLDDAVPWMRDALSGVIPEINNLASLALDAPGIFERLGLPLDSEGRRQVAELLSRISATN